MAKVGDYNRLPETRQDLGYKWEEITPEKAMEYLGKYLKRQNAKCFVVDVYSTGDHIFRNMIIQLPYQSEMFLASDLSIQFGRDEGRQITILFMEKNL